MTSRPVNPLGALCVIGGVLAVLAGIYAGGPDLVGGIVFGSVALAAGAVILARPGREK